MNLFIFTQSHDVHADAVLWALEFMAPQVKAHYFVSADLPSRQTTSLHITPKSELSHSFGGENLRLSAQTLDVIWMRRMCHPVIPDSVHPADRVVASRENNAHFAGLLRTINPNAFWVNPLSVQYLTSHKAVQLREASTAGLIIPDTLMSNDPETIRDFYKHYQGNIIYKPYYQAHWETEDGGQASAFTNKVTPEVLQNDFALRYSPGIYQPFVPKAGEVRLTAIGQHAFAAKLESSDAYAAELDWRANQAALKATPIEVPSQVWSACQALMKRLNIVFGCFDFIITPSGEWVFLEVNEMGQFLWVEHICPELPLLAAFTQMLIAGQPSFDAANLPPIHFHTYVESNRSEQFLADEETKHPATDNPFLVKE